MSKAEDYIREHTSHCSNSYWDKNDGESNFPWLSPDQARRAVEIAREEIIESVVEFLSKEENIPLWDDNSGNFGCDDLLLIKKLKQAIKYE